MNRTRHFAILSLAVLGATAFALAPLGGNDYDLSWFSIDSGGGLSAGGDFELAGTIGQHDAGGPMTGGDFSLTGGFWAGAATGGDALPVTLDSIQVVFGTHLSGGLPEVAFSDDTYFRGRSKPGFSAFEANKLEVQVLATSPLNTPTSFDTLIESRINNPNGTANVRFRNWMTNLYDSIGSYAIPLTDQVVIIENTAAGNYVRASDGAMDMNLKITVLATFSPLGFDAFLDQIAITVE